MKKLYIALAFICIVQPVHSSGKKQKKTEEKIVLKKKGIKGRPFDTMTPKRVKNYLSKMARDSYSIGDKLLSLQSMKVITGTLPFYLIGRRADAVVHRQFYDIETHTNKNQPPKFLSDIALDDKYISLPFIGFGLIGWLHHNPYKRRRAQVFTTGLAWSFLFKTLIKQIKVDGNLRPWHENFDRHKRAHGGNPSGHMTITAYMATYWALEKGRSAAVPLALFTTFALTMNVASNHHYLSQAIAGTGFGVMLGMAAHAAFRSLTVPEHVTVGLGTDQKGNLGIRFAYDF
jgi:hypothetical protein